MHNRHTTTINDKTIQYAIIRSKKRKRVALHIDPNNGLIVKVPNRLKIIEIENIIQKKANWVGQKLANNEELQRLQPTIRVKHNGSLQYLGNTITLCTTTHTSSRYLFHFKNDILSITLPHHIITDESLCKSKLHDRVVMWYKQQATKFFGERIDHFTNRINIKPKAIKIRTYKARWGSTRSNGIITLNWKLMMAPPAIIDYVIIHELCHLTEMNHSSTYWKLVEAILPDYRQRRKWLKDYGSFLNLDASDT